MSPGPSYRRIPYKRNAVPQTLARMVQQLDGILDIVCMEQDALLQMVCQVFRVTQESADPKSALEYIQSLLAPWVVGDRATHLQVNTYAPQVCWQQNAKCLQPDLQFGADHLTRMKTASDAAAAAKTTEAERRHARWIAEAQTCLDANPKWSNWRIAQHLAKQFKLDPDFQVRRKHEIRTVTSRHIYKIIQKYLPRR